MLPNSVNYHINQACNYACRHCFATFVDVREQTGLGMLPKHEQLALIKSLDEAGFEKLTLAGGEPTLMPWLDELFATFSRTTMLVTNGSRLDEHLLDRLAPHLDWVVLSIDAVDPEVSRRIGRAGRGGTVLDWDDYMVLAERLRERGLRLKINTVVSRTNLGEDMSPLIRAMAPERWKILQVLPVEGQNDEFIHKLRIEKAQFDDFVQTHALNLKGSNVTLVPEACEEIRGSYAMIDPAGRFFDNTLGCYTYSQPVLEVGVQKAFEQVAFDVDMYHKRGGVYEWS